MLRQFCIVVSNNSREHLLARESAELRRVRSSSPGFGPMETRFQGAVAFGLRLRKMPRAVLKEPRFLPALLVQIFGSVRSSDRTPARCSGLRAGDRFGSPDPFGERADRKTRQAEFGDGTSLRRPTVRFRKLGCPADPGFRREGAGRSFDPGLSGKVASLPRVGKLADPGQRGCRKATAPRFTGRGRHPQGRRSRPGKLPA